MRRTVLGGMLMVGMLLAGRVLADEASQVLYLQLVVNETVTEEYALVRLQDDTFQVQGAPLRAILPRLPIPEGEWVGLNELELSAEYRPASQQLRLHVATEYLPHTRLGMSVQSQPLSFGRSLIFNYDAFAQQNRQRVTSEEATFIGIQGGMEAVSGPWSFRHQQFYRNQVEDGQSSNVRLDTAVWYQDYDRLYTLIAGDLVSSASSSARGYRMGGIYIGRDYSLSPDLITFPLPDFAGSAVLPSTTELFIDGVLSGQGEIPAGPFSFDTRPFLSGAGTAQLVTTDIFGRVVTEERSFYVTEQLLAPGFDDFGLSVGHLRQNYSQRSADYDSALSMVGFYRRGLSQWMSAGLNTEWSNDISVFGAEMSVQLGRSGGVLNTGYRRSQREENGSGREYSVAYRYDERLWSFSAQHIERTEDFTDLGHAQTLFPSPRQTSQMMTSFRIPEYGSLSFGWFLLRHEAAGIGDVRQDNELLSVSFSPRLRRGVSLFFSANRDMTQNSYAVSLNLTVNLSIRRYAAFSANSDSANSRYGRIQVASGAPNRYGASWTLSQTLNQPQDVTQALLNYNHSLAEGYLGVFGPTSELTGYGGVRGSVVRSGQQFFLSAPVHQAFAIVDTDGEADVPVYISNLYSGSTNARGYLVATNLMANIDNRISIDPLGLDVDVMPSQYETWVRPAGRVGVPVRFDMARDDTELVRIEDADGTALPFGSEIKAQDASWSLGWDGEVVLPRAARSGHLRIKRADGDSCNLQPGDGFIRQCL